MRVAAVEVILYAVSAIILMMRAGQGSGVWIPALPLFWLAMAVRLWVILKCADLFAGIGTSQFVIVGSAFGFLFSLFALALMGAGSSSWTEYKWTALLTLGHLCAAVLAARYASQMSAMTSAEDG